MSTILRQMTGRPRGHALAFALAALVVPAVLAAQQPQRADSSHCICWNQDMTNLAQHMPGLIAVGRRAMIGVTIAPDSGQGVHVQDVTPGGPAARAGLKAGDVITGIDKVDLGTMSGSDSQEALIDHLDSVAPGDTVAVTYRRDGRTQHAKIVTESASRLGVFSTGPGERIIVRPGMGNFITSGQGIVTPGHAELPQIIRRTIVERDNEGIPGLNVVDVNSTLGKYFDVDHGVLVVNVTADSKLNLQPGDVILRIGDRNVQDAWHAVRILRSYQPSEDIHMEIVRQKKHMTITGHLR